jgi:hypothetical protein
MKHSEYIPDQSWLHGKYKFNRDTSAEINTKLPYVAIETYENSFFWQGEEADQVLTEIHNIWISDGRRTTTSAIKKYINLYL